MSYIDAVFADSSPALKAVMVWSETLTTAALAASVGVQEQTFTVTPPQPLRTTDLVFVAPPPAAPTTLAAVSGARVVSATQIAVQFTNLTAAANNPIDGVHGFLVLRP